MSLRLSIALGWSRQKLILIGLGALTHDIGMRPWLELASQKRVLNGRERSQLHLRKSEGARVLNQMSGLYDHQSLARLVAGPPRAAEEAREPEHRDRLAPGPAVHVLEEGDHRLRERDRGGDTGEEQEEEPRAAEEMAPRKLAEDEGHRHKPQVERAALRDRRAGACPSSSVAGPGSPRRGRSPRAR